MKTEEITRFDRLVQQDAICQAILTELEKLDSSKKVFSLKASHLNNLLKIRHNQLLEY
jgi:hypothetical protein